MIAEPSIAVAEPLWQELTSALAETDEKAGIIFAGRADGEKRQTLCLNRIIWAPDSAYLDRGPRHLEIDSSGWMPALGDAIKGKWQPIFFHTHPRAPALPSRFDEEVRGQLTPTFEARGAAYAELILGGTTSTPTFTGRLGPDSVVRLRVVGKRLHPRVAEDSPDGPDVDLDAFDRQIRAFGKDGQRILRRLRVGIAGSGGTGSAVFEQLTRLGVGSIVIVDDDVVTKTNVSRIYGSTIADVGRRKVEVMAEHAERIGLDTTVTAVPSKVTDQAGFAALRDCDIVFGCTDDEGGRGVLSRLAYYYCLPVIDVGVVITAHDREVRGLDERLTVIVPGAPCLFCRDRIDATRIREEKLSPGERMQLAEEGYARGLPERDPSVVTYTTMIASFAVDEMLQRLFGFGSHNPSNELLIRVPQREIRRLAGDRRDGCFCADPTKLGRADRDPPLDISWS